MNLAVAAFNLSCALYWLCQLDVSMAGLSVAGAFASIAAFRVWRQSC